MDEPLPEAEFRAVGLRKTDSDAPPGELAQLDAFLRLPVPEQLAFVGTLSAAAAKNLAAACTRAARRRTGPDSPPDVDLDVLARLLEIAEPGKHDVYVLDPDQGDPDDLTPEALARIREERQQEIEDLDGKIADAADVLVGQYLEMPRAKLAEMLDRHTAAELNVILYAIRRAMAQDGADRRRLRAMKRHVAERMKEDQ